MDALDPSEPRGGSGRVGWERTPAGLVASAALLSTVSALSTLSALGLSGCRRATGSETPPATARPIQSPDELLWGPAATGAIGDLVLENGRLLAVITRGDSASGFATSPGNLVDLAPLPDGEDHINEVFLYLGDEFPRQARYTKVEIVAAGGGKKPARVRARGTDTGDPRIHIETDYILRPGEHWLTLETRFTSTSTAVIRGYQIGDAIQWGRTEHMAPGHGFNLPGRRVEVDWVGGIGRDTSYALVPDGQRRFDSFNGSMWSDPIGATVDLHPKRTVSYVRHVVVGRGDTASLASAIAHLRGDRVGRLTGRVTHGTEPVRDALIWIMEAESGEVAGLAKVDRNGWYTIDLPPGEYRARADAPGRISVLGAEEPTRVRADDTSALHFEIGAQGVLAWRIEGHDGRAPPVRVTVVGLEGTQTPRFGPVFRADGAENQVLSARGAGELPISPGRYRVIVSRGLEFELVEAAVEIAPGRRSEITGRLVHAVPTPGFISTDLHQHAAPSFDSGVSLEDRALSNAAEGVEVLVSTEHNTLVDYRPVIAAAGLGRSVASVIGVEATTHTVGHFNALPLRPRVGAPRNGMVDPEGMTPSRIFQLLRELAEPGIEPFIQVNHPRSGKTGYFEMMKLDAKTGRAADPRWDASFDGVEVLTLGREEETQAALADWFALLRQGRRVTGVGTSDSHTITLRPVGWPRTFVCVEDDDPPHLNVSAFVAALRAGCATVSAGPLVLLSAGAVPMGGLLAAPGGEVEIEVEVRAASWIPTDRLVLYVDGEVQREIPIDGTQLVRHRSRQALRCARDCFVVAYVDSARSLAPVLSERKNLEPRPIGVTNPIYVDVDGDGRYDPTSSGARP